MNKAKIKGHPNFLTLMLQQRRSAWHLGVTTSHNLWKGCRHNQRRIIIRPAQKKKDMRRPPKPTKPDARTESLTLVQIQKRLESLKLARSEREAATSSDSESDGNLSLWFNIIWHTVNACPKVRDLESKKGVSAVGKLLLEKEETQLRKPRRHFLPENQQN